VVVTGGSQGIGRVLAEEFFKLGAKVTIMARTKAKLDKAVEEIVAANQGASGLGEIKAVAADVTDIASVQMAMQQAVDLQAGLPIFSLILSAGRAVPGYFLDQDAEVFRNSMAVNYLGPVNCAKVVAPLMLSKGTKGEIVFVSSAVASAAFIGYASYAPTKAALRSFSDALRNELKGTGISVHIAYPPDTDTPGFEEENKTKPKETLEISPPEVYSAKKVSDSILDGLLRGEYHLPSPDLVQNLLISTSVNVTPRGRWALLEIMLGPILSVVMLAFGWNAGRIASGYGRRVAAELKSRDD